jgi:hypothetical protein
VSKNIRNVINYPVGSRVIVRDNENSKYRIGELVRWESPNMDDKNWFPFVKMEDDKKEYLVMGIIRHYSNELIAVMDKLTPREQWNIMCEFAIIERTNE